MSSKSPSEISNGGSDSDYSDEAVDPRVQIELERLNTSTDEINKLEVDLDDARSKFRQLLCETTVQIDAVGKKLGACVERARPYYDARIKAKEALLETQKAAVKFERANSAHTAAKEMVFLAEEGLKAEGRTFDHAWQEMLNHATMRVNESEMERTVSETEHRKTSQNYHQAEQRVKQLQKDLKRSITRSSLNARRNLLMINNLVLQHRLLLLPYFELKSKYNQQLEDQKQRVKQLEKRVSQAKASYAEALRNLEQISDEIHKIRNHEILGGFSDPLGVRGLGVGAESPMQSSINNRDALKANNNCQKKCEIQPFANSSISGADSEQWSHSEHIVSSDFDSSDEYLTLPNQIGPKASPVLPRTDTESPHLSQYLGLSGLAGDTVARQKAAAKLEEEILKDAKTTRLEAERRPSLATSTPSCQSTPKKKALTNPFLPLTNSSQPHNHMSNNLNGHTDSGSNQTWTAINLADSSSDNSPSPDKGESGAKENKLNGSLVNDFPYHPLLEHGEEDNNPFRTPLSDITPLQDEKVNFDVWNRGQNSGQENIDDVSQSGEEVWTEVNLNDEPETPTTAGLFKKVSFFNSNFSCGVPRNASIEDDRRSSVEVSTPPPSARGSVSLQGTPLKQRMKLDSSLVNWISRSSAAGEENIPTVSGRRRPDLGSRRQSLDTLLWNGPASERVKDILSHGIMMLNISSLTERRSSEPRADNRPGSTTNPMAASFTTVMEQSTLSQTKPLRKVPSPLEKSITYLNHEDDSASDTESLHSVDMLTDEQISSLMLEPDLQLVCEDVLGTPITELLPGYPKNQI